ncbi:MAG TPA: phosphoribulokinase [Methanoregulaceae archaeon]|nr:phosphoribulokinase [Methanoregulaceae archaeon]HQJ88494.1 phosphoribulokinase [Methanoregulaceae archaeon]
MDVAGAPPSPKNNGGPNFKEIIRESPCVFAIGVAGDSGSGKTTFTQSIREIFGEDLVSTITLDDYHLYDRKQRRERGITPLDPAANRIEQIESDLIAMKEGRTIEKPVYDHSVGTFGDPVLFTPGKILILEGLHTLFSERLREHLDFTLFVEPDRRVKEDWKIRRDMAKRGYERDQVLREIREREPDYLRYIAPQREFADVVIRISHSKYGSALARTRNVYQVSLLQDPMDQAISDVDLGIDLFSVLSLSERNFLLEFIHHEDPRRRRGEIVIDGELGLHVVQRLEQSIEEQTHVRPISLARDREYVTAVDVAQLLIAWRIIHRRIFLERCRGAFRHSGRPSNVEYLNR